MTSKNWPPPGFPLVEGNYNLTAEWSIHLPDKFARRIEDGSLVLWRPGITLWLAAWGNDKNETQAQRLAWIKSDASPARFAEKISADKAPTRFSYRLRDQSPTGPVESLNASVLNNDGSLQVSIYFDNPADEITAQQLVDSITPR